MKPLSRISLSLAAFVLCVAMVMSCSKPSFKDGVGLFSEKQYHAYAILSVTDTAKLADERISIIDLGNNYLSFNGVTFRINSTNNDSLVNYVHDTAIAGNTVYLYYLNYYPKKDSISAYDNPTTKYWRSF